MPEILEYCLSPVMIAEVRRGDAWSMPLLALVELHQATLGRVGGTSTTKPLTALVLVRDLQSDRSS